MKESSKNKKSKSLLLGSNIELQAQIKKLISEQEIVVDVAVDKVHLSKKAVSKIKALSEKIGYDGKVDFNQEITIVMNDLKIEEVKAREDVTLDIPNMPFLVKPGTSMDVHNEQAENDFVESSDAFPSLLGEKGDILNNECITYKPLKRGCIKPVVVGDLLRVEKTLCNYEMGEIASIENIMLKERKETTVRDSFRTTRINERTVDSSREEVDSTKMEERFQLSAQSQKAQEENFKISAGINASYKTPVFSASISSNAAYSNSKSSSYSTSTNYAKNITKEASKKIKESIRESEKVTVVTESSKTALHGFDNREGTGHIVGIYQWLDKVYNAQLFDYGKRLFLEFMVPEPAFFLREVEKVVEGEELTNIEKPIHPKELLVPIKSFRDINETNYPTIAASYGVTDIITPPLATLYGGKAIVHPEEDPGSDDEHSGDGNEPTLVKSIKSVFVKEGYTLESIMVKIPLNRISKPIEDGAKDHDYKYGYHTTVGFSTTTNDVNVLMINAANKRFWYLTNNEGTNNDKGVFVNHSDNLNEWQNIEPYRTDIMKLEGEIPINVGMEGEGKFYFNFFYQMKRKQETIDQWKIETYAKIIAAYDNKLRAYNQQLSEASVRKKIEMEQTVFSQREAALRSIEQTELKKHCIEILTNRSAFAELPKKLVSDSNEELQINLSSLFGMPNWQANNVNGKITSFFEDSFEWNQISYNFYPYFWTDKERWKDLLRVDSVGDPTFDLFLKSGAAKVIVPIMPEFERSVLFFLKTKHIWSGGDLPTIDDEKILALLAEVEDGKQLGKGEGIKIGDSWEVKLPTNLVMLKKTEELPEFDCSDEVETGEKDVSETEVNELNEQLESAYVS